MRPEIRALAEDAQNIAATLWVLGRAAGARGDGDDERAHRFLARAAERIAEELERIDTTDNHEEGTR